MNKKIRIFDYCWHIPHQWDLIQALKNDCDFYYCLNTKRDWDITQRPIPENLQFVTHYNSHTYDLAILHIDQQMIAFDHQKFLIYNQFNNIISDIPKIVINHGTPVFPERFRELGYKLSEKEMQTHIINVIKHLIGKNTMVVNSYTAASKKEWGFGIPVVHGMNPSEWLDLKKEPRVFTAVSPIGFNVYYNRRCMMQVADLLYKKHGYILHYAKINADTDSSPQAYKEYLGKSLIYLDPSYRTPMNRARTEAFLSGCCVIQVEGAHDLDRWAKPGENIVIVPNNPEKIVEKIKYLLENNFQKAIEIGQNGKKMAIEMFNRARYRSDWLNLIKGVLKNF